MARPHASPNAADLLRTEHAVARALASARDEADAYPGLLAAIGESRDRGAKAIEAFAYRYPEGESVEERFLVHRTVFPRDFLDEFGFTRVRSQGRVELCRLELGGLVPVEEGRRAKVLRVVQDAFTPGPAPAPVPRP